LLCDEKKLKEKQVDKRSFFSIKKEERGRRREEKGE